MALEASQKTTECTAQDILCMEHGRKLLGNESIMMRDPYSPQTWHFSLLMCSSQIQVPKTQPKAGEGASCSFRPGATYQRMLWASLTRGVDSLGAHPGVVDLLLNDPVEDLLLLLAVVDHPLLRIHNTESKMKTCSIYQFLLGIFWSKSILGPGIYKLGQND